MLKFSPGGNIETINLPLLWHNNPINKSPKRTSVEVEPDALLEEIAIQQPTHSGHSKVLDPQTY